MGRRRIHPYILRTTLRTQVLHLSQTTVYFASITSVGNGLLLPGINRAKGECPSSLFDFLKAFATSFRLQAGNRARLAVSRMYSEVQEFDSCPHGCPICSI